MWVNLKALAPIEDGDLHGMTRYVALEAALHADGRGRVTMTITDLACHLGVSQMTVARAFDSLIAAGLLERPRQGRYLFRGAHSPTAVSPQDADSDVSPQDADSFASWWGENYGPDHGDTFAVLDNDEEGLAVVRLALEAGRITRIEHVMLTDGGGLTRYRLDEALGTGAPNHPH